MKFAVKIASILDGVYVDASWDYYDDPRVKSHRDAFIFGVVLTEHWNSDLRPGELRKKVLNGQVIGPGQKMLHKPPLNGQMNLPFNNKRVH